MKPYELSEMTKPLDLAASEAMIRRFKPLDAAAHGIIIAEVGKKLIPDPQQLAVRLLAEVADPPRVALLRAADDSAKAADDFTILSVYPNLAAALLELVIRDEVHANVPNLKPAPTAKGVSRAFAAKGDQLYQDAISQKLDRWGVAIDQKTMTDLHRHLTAKKIKLDSPDLRIKIFEFLGKIPAAPVPPAAPAASSAFVKPLTDVEVTQVLKDLLLLTDAARKSVRRRIKDLRISDPQIVRAMAVEAAISSQKIRELTRSIRSIVSLDGGSGYLRGFAKLPETILYEFITEKKKTLVDLCHNEVGCELRTFAESFFRDQKDELYKDRIREALSDRGFSLDEQRLEHTYRHMLRQRIPLPGRPLPGVIR